MTKPSSTPALPEVGDQVRTPSGAQAEVLAIYANDGEALVQWTTGDRAKFKLTLLKRVPKQ